MIINSQNADIFYKLVSNNNIPTIDEIEKLEDKELAKRLFGIFIDSTSTESLTPLLNEYYKVKRQERISKFLEVQKKKKMYRDVIIHDVYYSRFSEPIRKKTKISYTKKAGTRKFCWVQDFSMVIKEGKIKTVFLCSDVADPLVSADAKMFMLKGGADHRVDGEFSIVTDKYRDKFKDYLVSQDFRDDRKIDLEFR